MKNRCLSTKFSHIFIYFFISFFKRDKKVSINNSLVNGKISNAQIIDLTLQHSLLLIENKNYSNTFLLKFFFFLIAISSFLFLLS